ncbi:hypothetical protein GGR56DRAFT_660659 [Xylariaceae sp. FL0804]|nr:hypothetical protein GGR56DRAFT_660659 [Xylariaceae sp. FL0804]
MEGTQGPIDTPPASEGDSTTGVSGLVIALAVISVALRFYTRFFTKQGLKTDDWLILAAMIATLVTAVLLLWGNAVDPVGLYVSENTDTSYIYTKQDVFYLQLAFASSVFYFTIAGATKLGILAMYYRIFFVSTAFRYQLFLSSILVVGWWIGCSVATLTNCIPLKWSWINSFADPRYCFNYNIFWMASGACEIFLDVLILTLPISVILGMRLSVKQKLTVSGIFLLGGFVIITGLVKVIVGYPPGSRVPSYSNTEVWTTVHAGMSIVCASLPILGPLIHKITESSLILRLRSSISMRQRAKGTHVYEVYGVGGEGPVSGSKGSNGSSGRGIAVNMFGAVEAGTDPSSSHIFRAVAAPDGCPRDSSSSKQTSQQAVEGQEMFMLLPHIEAVGGSELSLDEQLARFMERGEPTLPARSWIPEKP